MTNLYCDFCIFEIWAMMIMIVTSSSRIIPFSDLYLSSGTPLEKPCTIISSKKYIDLYKTEYLALCVQPSPKILAQTFLEFIWKATKKDVSDG